MARRAAFIDRDDTLIGDTGYLDDPSGVALLPGAAEAVRLLNAAGVLAVCITNQGGVALGFVSEPVLHDIHDRMRALLAAEGARLDDLLYCPHHPDGTVDDYACVCDCRKPEPGMILTAADRHGIDLPQSVMIGDAERDVEAGRRAGCRSVLIRSGDAGAEPTVADHVTHSLLAAVRWYLALGAE